MTPAVMMISPVCQCVTLSACDSNSEPGRAQWGRGPGPQCHTVWWRGSRRGLTEPGWRPGLQVGTDWRHHYLESAPPGLPGPGPPPAAARRRAAAWTSESVASAVKSNLTDSVTVTGDGRPGPPPGASPLARGGSVTARAPAAAAACHGASARRGSGRQTVTQ